MALARSLRMRDLVVMGLLFIGPMAPVGLFGTLDALSSGVVPLVYLVATIVMGFTAWSYNLMSRAVPDAGAVYAYSREGLNPAMGFIAGWIILLDYLFIPAVACLFSAISLNVLMPTVPVWLWALLIITVITTLNLTGWQKIRRLTMAIVIAELFVLILILLGGLWVIWQQGMTRPLLSPIIGSGAVVGGAVLSGVSVAVLSFLGFDAIATFAEENKGSDKQPGRAILWCLLLTGILFMAQTWLGALLSPWDSQLLQQQPALQGKAYYVIVQEVISPWLGSTLAIVKAVGAAFSGLVGQAAAGRLLFSMARSSALPPALKRVSKRSGLPLPAIVVAALINALLAVAAATADDGLTQLVSFVDTGAICGFILLHCSVIGFFLVKQRRRGGVALVSYGVVPALGCITLLPVLFHMHLTALIAGALWLLPGMFILWYRRPEWGVKRGE